MGDGNWWGLPRRTPVHASWLNQAEPLIGAFAYHYLKRGSWASREEFLAHIAASRAGIGRHLGVRPVRGVAQEVFDGAATRSRGKLSMSARWDRRWAARGQPPW